MTGILVPAIGTAALLFAGTAVFIMRGGTSGRMRERVRRAVDLDSATVATADRTIRVMAPDERRPLLRLAMALGYNPELPPGYAASPLFVIPIACMAGALVYWRAGVMFGSLTGGVAAVVAVALVARFLLRRKSQQYAELLFRQIPDATSFVMRAVRAGLPVGEALRGVSREMPSPTREEFSRVMGEAALGVPIETALSHLYARTQVREYAFFAVTIGLNRQTGGNLAETLEILADTVRRRVAMAAKARALASEARASAAILGALPFAVGLIITAINPGYMNELFTDPRGPNLILAFVVLLSCGMFTIRWIIKRSSQG
jgi:tight adherence protein B